MTPAIPALAWSGERASESPRLGRWSADLVDAQGGADAPPCGTVCPGGVCANGYCKSCSFSQPDSTTSPNICAGFGTATGVTSFCPNMEPNKTRRLRFRGTASDACAQAFQYLLVSEPKLAGGADIVTSDPGAFDFTRDALGPRVETTASMSLNLIWCSGSSTTCDVGTTGVELFVESLP